MTPAPRGGRQGAVRFAVLLRGVNVGTKNSLPMAELREILEGIGCAGVRTLLQSGNAIVETRLGERELTRAVEAAVSERMGRHVAATARTARQLRAVLDANPFVSVATDPARQCVTFLSDVPAAGSLAPILDRGWSPELVRVAGRELHTWYPDGQARSPLAEAISRLPLRGTVTTRNWKTVARLAGMLGPPDATGRPVPDGARRRRAGTGRPG